MSEETKRTPPAEPAIPRAVAVVTERTPYRTTIEARGHTLVADEPVSLGGTDAGPTPFDLLCAALGSCTTITVRMYADRKKWPLEEIGARVFHQRIEAAGEGGRGPRDRFRVEVRLEGDLDEAQRARLFDIAGRCPVHRTLLASAEVETMLVEQSPA
jgi:uncharacterized OsmC-like protein